jgi:hypothetical protein
MVVACLALIKVQYLVFLEHVGSGLVGALTASLYFWSKRKGDSIKKPIKTKDGNYLVENEKDLEKDVNYDAKIEIDLAKNPDYVARLPDPKGQPTSGPR